MPVMSSGPVSLAERHSPNVARLQGRVVLDAIDERDAWRGRRKHLIDDHQAGMPRDDDVERALHLRFGKSEHLGGIGGRLSSRQVSREHEYDGDGHVMEVYVNLRRRNPSLSCR